MNFKYEVAVPRSNRSYKRDVKNILNRDIFDIFFCLMTIKIYIRGPPY